MLARNPARCRRTLRHSASQPALRPSRITTHHSPLTTPSALRRAFTLVEIMVAIIIIVILMSILLPVINSARTRANETKVLNEIRQLDTAITAFKVKFGIAPPSRFIIHLSETGWTNDAPSKGLVRRIWPQFDFRMNTGNPPGGQSYPSSWDQIASNQGHPEFIGINSGECLLFFLGGLHDDTTGALTGFAKNPAYPFAPRAVAASREGPFLEFTDVSRIRDTDKNGMYELVDALPNQTNPYLYFSSYDGTAYHAQTSGTVIAELPVNGFIDVYRVSKAPAGQPGAATTFSLPAHKAQSYQIISPGMDNQYGMGGSFNPALPSAGLFDRGDYDNLTNFHGGRLNP